MERADAKRQRRKENSDRIKNQKAQVKLIIVFNTIINSNSHYNYQ